jgi:hypothetical protein
MRAFLTPKISRQDLLRPSAIALIAANCVPLVGVFVFRWEVFSLVFLFWFENAIIGVLNAVKMIFASPQEKAQWAAKIFLVPFFCVHYGMFTFVHGVFVIVLFGGGMKPGGFPSFATFVKTMRELNLGWAVLGLFVSHAFSLIYNYFVRGECRRAAVTALMGQPYGRIVVLHLAIILGGMLMLALKSPVFGLALLVVLKTLLDLSAHVRERAKFAPPSTVPNPAN